ncbi:hypothetical protein FALBO_14111, partial [Fusarium albosuccineum]
VLEVPDSADPLGAGHNQLRRARPPKPQASPKRLPSNSPHSPAHSFVALTPLLPSFPTTSSRSPIGTALRRLCLVIVEVPWCLLYLLDSPTRPVALPPRAPQHRTVAGYGRPSGATRSIHPSLLLACPPPNIPLPASTSPRHFSSSIARLPSTSLAASLTP